MKTITIFCSASDLENKYVKPAEEFARLLPRNGYDLVWGGSNTGLMKAVASAVKKSGGKLIGVSVEFYKHLLREDADEKIIAKTLGERKATMLLRGDAIAVLVGGIGTLDEVTEVIELRKQGHHNKPIVILNTENFYEGLKMQLQKMKNDGFIPNNLDELVYFADTPQEAINYINNALGNSNIPD
jgi:uncharacterized protein (TIGR00730 family)